ncbi:hypothetical protein SLE2022_209880 [Rubroshorea leprosula]
MVGGRAGEDQGLDGRGVVTGKEWVEKGEVARGDEDNDGEAASDEVVGKVEKGDDVAGGQVWVHQDVCVGS